MAFNIVYNIIANDRFSRHTKNITRNLEKMSNRVNRLNNSIGRTGTNFRKTENAFNRLGRSGRGLTRALSPMIGVTAGGGLAMGLGAMGVAAVMAGAKFEKSMNMLRATTNATGASFIKMRSQARKLGSVTQFTATQVGEAQKFMAVSGMNVNEILGATPAVLKLAAATQTDFATSADIVTKVMHQYGIKASGLNKANNNMVFTVMRSNTTMQLFGASMRMVGTLAHTAGLKFSETSATIGMLGNAGLQGTLAGTSFRRAIAGMINPTKAMQKIMKQGHLTFTKSNGKLLSMVHILKNLEKSGITTAGVMALFGQRAGPAMLGLLEMGSAGLKDFQDQMKKNQKIVDRLAKVQLEGLSGAWLKLKSAMEAVGITTSNILEPVLLSAASGVTALLLKTNALLISLSSIASELSGGKFKKAGKSFGHMLSKVYKSVLGAPGLMPPALLRVFGDHPAPLGYSPGLTKFLSPIHAPSGAMQRPSSQKIHSRVDVNLHDPNNYVKSMGGTTDMGDINLNLGSNMAFARM